MHGVQTAISTRDTFSRARVEFVSSDSVDWYALTVTRRCRYLLAMLLVRDQGSLYQVL
jgi:hypothetical protein